MRNKMTPAQIKAMHAKKSQGHPDSHLLRAGINAENNAIINYQHMAAQANDKLVAVVFEDIAKEEMTHVGEFTALLDEQEPQQAIENKKGKAEVAKIGQGRYRSEEEFDN